jgi:nicotinamide mononucleotide (NMN) deamidase PncC
MSAFPPGSILNLQGWSNSTALSHSPYLRLFPGSLTTQLYTLESRIAFAGWTQSHIDNYKGPTPDIVAGLATHVRNTLQSTYTIAESGTAGPTGGATRNRTPYVLPSLRLANIT